MKRLAASLILGLGLMFGVVVGGAGLAGATTTAAAHHRVCLSTDSSGTKTCAETSPGAGSGLKHMKPTTQGHGSSPQHHVPGVTTPSPAASSVATSPASTLAFTGADVTATVVLGLLLIGGGLLLVRVTRRRTVLA